MTRHDDASQYVEALAEYGEERMVAVDAQRGESVCVLDLARFSPRPPLGRLAIVLLAGLVCGGVVVSLCTAIGSGSITGCSSSTRRCGRRRGRGVLDRPKEVDTYAVAYARRVLGEREY